MSEDPALHLIWDIGRIFIKPLPLISFRTHIGRSTCSIFTPAVKRPKYDRLGSDCCDLTSSAFATKATFVLPNKGI